MITIYIGRFGHDEIELQVAEGTTVGQALSQAGLSPKTSEKMFVDNVPAPLTAILEDGDIVSIVTPKQAG
jgi:sulfur carrier protein ThiS